MRLMIQQMERDEDAFREIIRLKADMVNLDHGDVFRKSSATHNRKSSNVNHIRKIILKTAVGIFQCGSMESRLPVKISLRMIKRGKNGARLRRAATFTTPKAIAIIKITISILFCYERSY